MSAEADPIHEDASLETPTVSTRAVLWSVLGFLLFAVLATAGLQAWFGAELGRNPQPESVFKEPRLQSDPRRDRVEVETAQRARLDHGRISIDDAMARVAARLDKAYDPVDEAAQETP